MGQGRSSKSHTWISASWGNLGPGRNLFSLGMRSGDDSRAGFGFDIAVSHPYQVSLLQTCVVLIHLTSPPSGPPAW